MDPRKIIVTGATSGIGLETARELCRRGASLVLACRNLEKADLVREELVRNARASVEVVHLDLASLDSVRSCARALNETGDPIDVLINNAGTFSMTRRETGDGFEQTIGVNHLGPFLLTSLLLPRLREASQARIVNVASAAYRYAHLRLDDLQRTRWGGNMGFAGFQAYAASRLATVLFTRELARRLEDTRITANCCHPGHVQTGIFPDAAGLMGLVMRYSSRFRIPAAEGAEPVVRLATDLAVATVTGVYFNRNEPEDVPAKLSDPDTARELWDLSAKLTGSSWYNRS